MQDQPEFTKSWGRLCGGLLWYCATQPWLIAALECSLLSWAMERRMKLFKYLLTSDGLGKLDQGNMHTLQFLKSAPQPCFSLTHSQSFGGTSYIGGLTFWFHCKTGLAEIF